MSRIGDLLTKKLFIVGGVNILTVVCKHFKCIAYHLGISEIGRNSDKAAILKGAITYVLLVFVIHRYQGVNCTVLIFDPILKGFNAICIVFRLYSDNLYTQMGVLLLLSFKDCLRKEVIAAFFHPMVFKNVRTGLNQEVELIIIIFLGNAGCVLQFRFDFRSFRCTCGIFCAFCILYTFTIRSIVFRITGCKNRNDYKQGKQKSENSEAHFHYSGPPSIKYFHLFHVSIGTYHHFGESDGFVHSATFDSLVF